MPRYKLTIEYDGTDISGWQRQDDAPSVQGYIEAAVQRFSGEDVTIHCAGRTDAGVHALAQIAHVDLQKEWSDYQVQHAINFHLHSEQVRVVAAEQVTEEFHARFSATHRRYFYRLINRRAPLALERGRAWHVAKPLDAALMQEAAKHLIGHYDFSTFRDSQCQGRTPFKTLDELRIDILDAGELRFHTKARSFLHHQVRNMVGSLVQVGLGKWNLDDFIAARDACDRRAGGPTAPAHGLYFVEVGYEGK